MTDTYTKIEDIPASLHPSPGATYTPIAPIPYLAFSGWTLAPHCMMFESPVIMVLVPIAAKDEKPYVAASISMPSVCTGTVKLDIAGLDKIIDRFQTARAVLADELAAFDQPSPPSHDGAA